MNLKAPINRCFFMLKIKVDFLVDLYGFEVFMSKVVLFLSILY